MRPVGGVLALLAAALGIFLALNHPLWPVGLTVAFVIWSVAVYWRPLLWLFVLPACLPFAGFSAWTGWIGVEEFDLVVLGAVAGSHARMAFGRNRRPPAHAGAGIAVRRSPGREEIGLLLLMGWSLIALARGLLDAGGLPLGWFQGYEEPLNSLRVGKSLLFVMLLLPSLRGLVERWPRLAGRCLAAGLASGLAGVSLAIVGERIGYPGLLDFSTPYRSTAWFWEMHVGGAAVDAFLALTVPFAVHAVVQARSRWRWLLAALLAMVAGYACLTTFSRGLYLGLGVSLIVLGALLASRRATAAALTSTGPGWRWWGNRLLLLGIAIEVVAVVGFGDFMGSRLSVGERDLGGRMAHWREGLSLLRSPAEGLFGRGLGRFPADYSQTVPGRQMPGRLRLIDAADGRHLRLFAGHQAGRSRSAFELLQRLPGPVAGTYTVTLDARAPQPTKFAVGLCHQHLLYAAACVQATHAVANADWRSVSLSLDAGDGLRSGWPVPVFFQLHLLGSVDFIDIDNLRVVDALGRQMLANGGFADGLSQWFFAGRHYFVPWHVDSLFLETLIDQGAIGLSLLIALLVMAMARLLRGPAAEHALSPYLLAALLACAVVGVFSSLLDMPRAAFLFHLLLCYSLLVARRVPEVLLKASPASAKIPREIPHSV
ncbi:MAG: hypothetical protein V5B33_04975 [Candidatus Accumulibacter sp. UW20]|jgi:hypothetical protein